MTNEEARAIMTLLKQSYINLRTKSDLRKKTVKENIKAYDMAIKALEQEPCEDAISRQAVLDGIDTYIYKAQSTGTQDDFYSFAELVVKQLPPINPQEPCKDWYDLPADEMTFKQARQAVKDLRIMLAEYLTQEPKTGHWIIYDVHGHKACKCSECDKDVGYPCNYKYCPYCGERMVESKELSE